MRSVVVVLPASIWALIPMLRYRAVGVLRLTRVSFVAAPGPAAQVYSAPLGAGAPYPQAEIGITPQHPADGTARPLTCGVAALAAHSPPHGAGLQHANTRSTSLAQLASRRNKVPQACRLGIKVAVIERIAIHNQFQALVHHNAQTGQGIHL